MAVDRGVAMKKSNYPGRLTVARSQRDLMHILEAIQTVDVARLRRLLGQTQIDPNQTWEGRLPLVEASGIHLDLVQPLLAAGADVNGQDQGGTTPLIKAAETGDVLIVRALLAAGAKPNILRKNVVSALWEAASTRSRRHLEVLRALIAAGADVNTLSHSKDGSPTGTVLIQACENGNAEGVRELLAAGAEINARVFFGTALTGAANEGQAEVVKILLKAGADPTVRLDDSDRLGDMAGKNALELARQNRHRRVVALLEPAATLRTPALRSATVPEAWQRLQEVLSRVRPNLLKTFRPPATEEDLTVLAATLGHRLPQEAEELFRLHDGQSRSKGAAFVRVGADLLETDFRFLRLRDIIQEWRMWTELLGTGEFRGRKSLPDAGVRDDWYNPGWIPLTGDGLGNYHCLDLAPAAGGHPGQIILMWHDQEARPHVAGNLAEWLNDIALDVET